MKKNTSGKVQLSQLEIDKINRFAEIYEVSHDTAVILSFLDSIGYRTYEVVQLIQKKEIKKGKKG